MVKSIQLDGIVHQLINDRIHSTWLVLLCKHVAEGMCKICQGSQLSWNSWNFTVVLKLSWNQQLYWNVTHLVRMSWHGPLLCCRYTFTSHDHIYVADVECQVMFSLVTLYCFMCNIALVTFLGLQYWSVSMINIYEHRKKTCIFCVLSLVKPTKCAEIF